MVVNDYTKAKSLVSDNAPVVFKKGMGLPSICVYQLCSNPHSCKMNHDLMSKNLLVLYNLVLEEVESKVEMFRNQLRSRLSILPIPLKDMRRYIKYEFCASFSQQISE